MLCVLSPVLQHERQSGFAAECFVDGSLPVAVGLHHDLYGTRIVIIRWLHCHLLLVGSITKQHKVCRGKPAVNMAMHHMLMLR